MAGLLNYSPTSTTRCIVPNDAFFFWFNSIRWRRVKGEILLLYGRIFYFYRNRIYATLSEGKIYYGHKAFLIMVIVVGIRRPWECSSGCTLYFFSKSALVGEVMSAPRATTQKKWSCTPTFFLFFLSSGG